MSRGSNLFAYSRESPNAYRQTIRVPYFQEAPSNKYFPNLVSDGRADDSSDLQAIRGERYSRNTTLLDERR